MLLLFQDQIISQLTMEFIMLHQIGTSEFTTATNITVIIIECGSIR